MITSDSFQKSNFIRVYSSKYFRVFKSDGPDKKIKISISKKFFKRAVDRNKIKRRVKEIFRENKIHSVLNHSIMFSIFKPFSELTYKEASCEIIKAMKEADKQ